MISACVVVHNEEQLIADMIQNVAPIIDELILVHDGEVHDKTLVVAEKECKKNSLDYKFFERDRAYVAEPHRPFAFSVAKNDWVLWIDADERLIGNILELKVLTQKEELALIKFRWGEKKELEKKSFVKTKSILFNKSKCYFVGIPHQKPQILEGDVVQCNNISLLHLENRRSFSKMLQRNIRWSKLITDFYFTDLSNINIWNGTPDVRKKIDKIFSKKKSFNLIKVFLSPLRVMFYSVLEGNNIKLTLSRGVNVFVLNSMIIYYKLFKK